MGKLARAYLGKTGDCLPGAAPKARRAAPVRGSSSPQPRCRLPLSWHQEDDGSAPKPSTSSLAAEEAALRAAWQQVDMALARHLTPEAHYRIWQACHRAARTASRLPSTPDDDVAEGRSVQTRVVDGGATERSTWQAEPVPPPARQSGAGTQQAVRRASGASLRTDDQRLKTLGFRALVSAHDMRRMVNRGALSTDAGEANPALRAGPGLDCSDQLGVPCLGLAGPSRQVEAEASSSRTPSADPSPAAAPQVSLSPLEAHPLEALSSPGPVQPLPQEDPDPGGARASASRQGEAPLQEPEARPMELEFSGELGVGFSCWVPSCSRHKGKRVETSRKEGDKGPGGPGSHRSTEGVMGRLSSSGRASAATRAAALAAEERTATTGSPSASASASAGEGTYPQAAASHSPLNPLGSVKEESEGAGGMDLEQDKMRAPVQEGSGGEGASRGAQQEAALRGDWGSWTRGSRGQRGPKQDAPVVAAPRARELRSDETVDREWELGGTFRVARSNSEGLEFAGSVRTSNSGGAFPRLELGGEEEEEPGGMSHRPSRTLSLPISSKEAQNHLGQRNRSWHDGLALAREGASGASYREERGEGQLLVPAEEANASPTWPIPRASSSPRNGPTRAGPPSGAGLIRMDSVESLDLAVRGGDVLNWETANDAPEGRNGAVAGGKIAALAASGGEAGDEGGLKGEGEKSTARKSGFWDFVQVKEKPARGREGGAKPYAHGQGSAGHERGSARWAGKGRAKPAAAMEGLGTSDAESPDPMDDDSDTSSDSWLDAGSLDRADTFGRTSTSGSVDGGASDAARQHVRAREDKSGMGPGTPPLRSGEFSSGGSQSSAEQMLDALLPASSGQAGLRRRAPGKDPPEAASSEPSNDSPEPVAASTSAAVPVTSAREQEGSRKVLLPPLSIVLPALPAEAKEAAWRASPRGLTVGRAEGAQGGSRTGRPKTRGPGLPPRSPRSPSFDPGTVLPRTPSFDWSQSWKPGERGSGRGAAAPKEQAGSPAGQEQAEAAERRASESAVAVLAAPPEQPEPGSLLSDELPPPAAPDPAEGAAQEQDKDDPIWSSVFYQMVSHASSSEADSVGREGSPGSGADSPMQDPAEGPPPPRLEREPSLTPGLTHHPRGVALSQLLQVLELEQQGGDFDILKQSLSMLAVSNPPPP